MRAAWIFGCGISLCLIGGSALAADKDEGKGTVVDLGGLKSTAPSAWKKQASKMAGKTEFQVPKAGDDKDDTVVIIFSFGPNGAGTADANIARWKGMLTPPEGKKIDDVSKVEKFKVGDAQVTYLDVSGTYLKKTRPFDPSDKGEKMPNYRLIGVVFESPKGPYYIRFVGPAKTVGENKKAFDEWLKAFK